MPSPRIPSLFSKPRVFILEGEVRPRSARHRGLDGALAPSSSRQRTCSRANKASCAAVDGMCHGAATLSPCCALAVRGPTKGSSAQRLGGASGSQGREEGVGETKKTPPCHTQRAWTQQAFKHTVASHFRVVPETQAEALNVKTSPKGKDFLHVRTAAPGPHSLGSRGARTELSE